MHHTLLLDHHIPFTSLATRRDAAALTLQAKLSMDLFHDKVDNVRKKHLVSQCEPLRASRYGAYRRPCWPRYERKVGI